MAESKVERYLIDSKLSYSEIAPNMWVIEAGDHGLEGVVVMLAEPIVVVRVAVMKIPAQKRLELFTRLLELNARDILHGAYAIEGDEIVLVDTLNYETMDQGDLQASLDAIELALVQHFPILSEFR